MKVIADRPTQEMYQRDLEIDCQCARCGSSVLSEACEYCEDGMDGHDCGEDVCCCRYPIDNAPCQLCDGTGVWRTCMSSADYCRDNPLPGREDVERDRIEWFTYERKQDGT